MCSDGDADRSTPPQRFCILGMSTPRFRGYSDRYRAVEVPVSMARGMDPQRVVELKKKIKLKSVFANHPSIAQ